ncbi:MAG: hypothetical protein R3B72_42860, partial [Polyangiaceae bacterium]
MAGAAPTSLVLVLAALAACGVEPQRLESVLPTLPPVEALVFAPTPSVFERAEGLAALPADTALVMVVDPPAIRALAVEVADAPVDEVFPALSLWASGISMSSPEAMGIATAEPWGVAWLHLPGVEVLADQAPIDRVEPPALEVRVVFARLESEEALLGSLARSVDARERTLFAEPIGDAHWYHSEQERPERAVVIRGEQVFFIEQLARVDGVADVTRDVARRLATIERPASLLGRAGFTRQVAAASLGPVGLYLQPGPWLRRAAATIERRRHPPPLAPEVSPSWPSFAVERPLLEARAAALDALATRVDALAGGLDLGPRGLRGRLSVFWRGAPLAVAAETPRLPVGGMSVALAPELLPELLTVVAGERVMLEAQGALDDEPLTRRLDGRLRMIQEGGAWRVDLGLATEVPDVLRGRVARALRTPVQLEEGWLRVGAAAFEPWVP